MALGVLIFIMVDILLLSLNSIIGEVWESTEVDLVPNKDHPRTLTGVRVVLDYSYYL